MSFKYVSENFESNFWFELLVEHPCENEVEDGEEGAHFLIWEHQLFAEEEIHVVKVKFEQFNFGWFFGRFAHLRDRFEAEDLGEAAPFVVICFSFS